MRLFWSFEKKKANNLYPNKRPRLKEMEWKTHIARENDETWSNDERTIWLNDEWLWNDKDTIELEEMTKCKDTIEFEEMIKCNK